MSPEVWFGLLLSALKWWKLANLPWAEAQLDRNGDVEPINYCLASWKTVSLAVIMWISVLFEYTFFEILVGQIEIIYTQLNRMVFLFPVSQSELAFHHQLHMPPKTYPPFLYRWLGLPQNVLFPSCAVDTVLEVQWCKLVRKRLPVWQMRDRIVFHVCQLHSSLGKHSVRQL